jgi:cellulose biosynthesis protein BcsQ
MSKAVAIINQKGGTGKTTTAVNLSAGIAKKGFSVLLVDLDPQAQVMVWASISTRIPIHLPRLRMSSPLGRSRSMRGA